MSWRAKDKMYVAPSIEAGTVDRGRSRAIRALTLAALTILLVACSVTSPLSRKVSYGETAKVNYAKGLAELKEENNVEAVKYFTFVKNKFPFSRFAKLAEIGIADAYFAQDKFMEAIDAYKLFFKLNPSHPRSTSGYVSHKICQANMKQIPSDWFLVPPSHEKDQGAIKDAMRSLVLFMSVFPKSKYAPEVKKLYQRCIRRLVHHELYVARFYLDRDKPKATILRLESVLKKFPDAGVDPEVMLLLGQTYLKLDHNKKAKATFAKMIKKYPKDPLSSKAKLFLDYMAGQQE